MSELKSPCDGQLEKLRHLAAAALDSGQVEMVIGFAAAPAPGKVTPIFCRAAAETTRLIFDERCGLNLANYLVRPELSTLHHIALVAKHADARAAVGLVQESQFDAVRLRIIAIDCAELADAPAASGGAAGDAATFAWTVADQLLTLEEYLAAAAARRPTELENAAAGCGAEPGGAESVKLAAMSPAERWQFWAAQFDRCIKCYACRQVCPLCFCQRCIADKNQPQWIDASSTPRGNFAWNLVRAFHLAGRCINCGACEAACPADIPLMHLNRQLRHVVAARFGYLPGYDAATDPPLATFSKDDGEEFIK